MDSPYSGGSNWEALYSQEYLAVEFQIVLIEHSFSALRSTKAEWLKDTGRFWIFLSRPTGSTSTIPFAVFIFLFFHLGIFVNMLDDYIIFLPKSASSDGLILRFHMFLERKDTQPAWTVFLDDFSYTVFIGRIQAVFIQVQRHGESTSAAWCHHISYSRTAVAYQWTGVAYPL